MIVIWARAGAMEIDRRQNYGNKIYIGDGLEKEWVSMCEG